MTPWPLSFTAVRCCRALPVSATTGRSVILSLVRVRDRDWPRRPSRAELAPLDGNVTFRR